MYVNCKHQIPYLGGYSKTGKIVFIDERLPRKYQLRNGKIIEPHWFLSHHEDHESIHLFKGYSYQEAHRRAAQYEKRLLKNAGVDVVEYYDFIYLWVKICLKDFDPEKVPPGLNLAPYVEDGLVEVLRKLNYQGETKKPQSITDDLLNKEKRKDIEL